MDFLSQKSKMKENRDQMLRKLEVKENEATRLRKVLEQSKLLLLQRLAANTLTLLETVSLYNATAHT